MLQNHSTDLTKVCCPDLFVFGITKHSPLLHKTDRLDLIKLHVITKHVLPRFFFLPKQQAFRERRKHCSDSGKVGNITIFFKFYKSKTNIKTKHSDTLIYFLHSLDIFIHFLSPTNPMQKQKLMRPYENLLGTLDPPKQIHFFLSVQICKHEE